jgi:drug/metabolite transporter (DMT)-like permease
MFGIWLLIRWKYNIRIEKKDYKTLIILSILNIPINQFLFFLSAELTTAPNLSLAYALSPAFVLIIAMIFQKEKASWVKILGVATAIGGVIFILSERGISFGSAYFTGNVLVLIASLSWALYTVIGKEFTTKYGAMYSTSLTMILGFIFYIPIFLISGYDLNLAVLTTKDWLQLLYLGIFASGVAYVIWYYALTKIDAAKVSLFNNLQPVLTTVLSIILFQQEITTIFVVGGLLIISGVVVAQKG